jgi:hypothetical protein
MLSFHDYPNDATVMDGAVFILFFILTIFDIASDSLLVGAIRNKND